MRRLRLLILSLVLGLSCTEDPALKNVCADPLGTADMTLTHDEQFCFKEGFNACFVLKFAAASQLIQAVDYTSQHPGTMVGMITDIGAVSCLGAVFSKPTNGFLSEVSAVENHGYVVKLPDNTYGRLFIHSWTKASSGAVSEIHITWQYAY